MSLPVLVSVLISCVSSETFYITTSSKSPCPLEFIGEPCLTLEQYASHYHRGSSKSNTNYTLMMEPGTHLLQSSGLRFGEYSNRINSFIMNAEHPGAKVVHEILPGEYFHSSTIYAQYIQTHGSFVGPGIVVNYAQEVMISNCSFQGVSISLREVTNATFSRCTFSDYRQYHHPDNVIFFYGSAGALTILDSTKVKIAQSNFTNNEVALYGHNYYNYYSSRVVSLHIQESIFSNNTSELKGGAIHLHGYISFSVNQSTFINNTASESSGAIYLEAKGHNLDFSITESSFIQNSAGSCGALNILTNFNTSRSQITDTTFESNKALRASDTGGGALCVTHASTVTSNCSFVGNTAAGFGGAFVSHNNMVIINHTIFHGNMAGGDGGALTSYAHPSDYTISQSTFTHNRAGDDGGAIFIGHRQSNVRIETCTFTNNYANDRGGAITVFGSAIEITRTTIDNNRAALGETFSSCNGNVMTSIYGDRDINCSYNGPTTNHFNNTIPLKGQNVINISLDVIIGDFCTAHQPSEPTTREVNRVTTAAYASLTISAIVVIAFLLFLSIEKLTRSKIKCMKCPTVLLTPGPVTQPQPEPLYAEATVQANSSLEMIEMKPNVLYGKCEPQNQAH